MTVSEEIELFENYLGDAQIPEHFEEKWKEKWRSSQIGQLRTEKIPFENDAAVYERWTVTKPDGTELTLRYIRPAPEKPYPTLLMFHDIGRGVRGWHHMTRFIALGYAVAALENRPIAPEWDAAELEERISDALIAARAVQYRTKEQAQHFLTWGEGFGGALAIAVAAVVPGVERCAALNPAPGDYRASPTLAALPEELDTLNFASLLSCPLLMGTGLMDEIAPPKAQYAIFNRARGEKIHRVYPCYAHERINFFENELIRYFL